MLAFFPLLLPESLARRDPRTGRTVEAWHGLMQCQQRSFRVRIVATTSEAAASNTNGAAHAQSALGPGAAGALANVLSASTDRSAAAAAAAAPTRHMLLQGEPALVDLLRGYEKMLTQRWNQSHDLRGFLVELQEIINRILRTAASVPSLPLPSSLPSASLYAVLLSDIAQLPGGWACVKEMDEQTARALTLVVTDAGKREHLMHVKLAEDYPHSPPAIQVDLPLPFDATAAAASASHHSLAGASSFVPSASPGNGSAPSSPLCAAFARFSSLVHSCQLFFDVLRDLGEHSWVLEPEQPIPRAVCHRRIAIGKSCWLELVVDPLHPTAIPEPRVLGNEAMVELLDGRLRSHLSEWRTYGADDPDAASSLRRNLMRVLELDALPLPTPINRDEFCLECVVCYSYKLEEIVPDWVCPNPRCSRPAHSSCMVQWLQGLPTTKTAFNTLYGTCPYCQEKITVSL